MNIWELSKSIMKEKEERILKERGKSVEELEIELSEILRDILLKAYSIAIEAVENISEKNEELIKDLVDETSYYAYDFNCIYIDVYDNGFDVVLTNEKGETMDYCVQLETNFKISTASQDDILEKITGLVLENITFDSSNEKWVRFVIFDVTTYEHMEFLSEENEKYYCGYDQKEYCYDIFEYRMKKCEEKEIAPWLVKCLISEENSRRAIVNVLKKIFPSAKLYSDQDRYDSNELVIEIDDITEYLTK